AHHPHQPGRLGANSAGLDGGDGPRRPRPPVWYVPDEGTLVADAILVLNAGSSSLKFSVFLNSERPGLLLRGQLEGLFTQPHFVARDAAGNALGERTWEPGTKLGHTGAIEFLFGWGRGKLNGHHIVAAGHRVVHGGQQVARPVFIDPEVMTALEALVPLAPL